MNIKILKTKSTEYKNRTYENTILNNNVNEVCDELNEI